MLLREERGESQFSAGPEGGSYQKEKEEKPKPKSLFDEIVLLPLCSRLVYSQTVKDIVRKKNSPGSLSELEVLK